MGRSHGTHSSYRHGCRCAECLAATQEYEWRRGNRRRKPKSVTEDEHADAIDILLEVLRCR